jgi:hypothetical protein
MVEMIPFVGRGSIPEEREDSENEILQRAQQWRESEERQRREYIEGLELRCSRLTRELDSTRAHYDSLHRAYEHLEKERSNERWRLNKQIQTQGKELYGAKSALERQNQSVNQLKRQVDDLNHELNLSNRERKELMNKVTKSEEIMARLERNYVGQTSDVLVTEKQIIKLYDELYDLVTLETVDIFFRVHGDRFLEAWKRVFRLFDVAQSGVHNHCRSYGLRGSIRRVGLTINLSHEDVKSTSFVISQNEKYLATLLSRKDSRRFMEEHKKHCLQELFQELFRQEIIPPNVQEIENLVVKVEDFYWKLIWNESTIKHDFSFEMVGDFLGRVPEYLQPSQQDIHRNTETLNTNEAMAVRQALHIQGKESPSCPLLAFPMLIKGADLIKGINLEPSKPKPIAYKFFRF